MSAVVPQRADELASPDEEPGGQPPRRRHTKAVVAAGGAVVVVAAAAAIAITQPFGNHNHPSSGVSDNGYPTALSTVTRQTVSSDISANATLGYAASYQIVNQAHGVLTWVPEVGQVIKQGQPLYQVNGVPVVLLYGNVPMYRALSQGMSGPDVHQLNRALVTLGYATHDELKSRSDYFSAATATALTKLQKHFGLQQTGSLPQGQVVFLPTAARITAINGNLGGAATPGPLMTATSTARQVSIALDASEQSYLAVGDRVTITMPNQQTTPGKVTSVGKVATSSGTGAGNTPTVTVLVTPVHPAATGSLDQAPVTVEITTQTASNVLAVPVNALLALASGGYAVEEVSPSGVHHLIQVTPGLFDDSGGVVQVSGHGLAAGQRVVVPAS